MTEINIDIDPPSAELRNGMHIPQKLLMGPGPSNVRKNIAEAGSLPLLGHLHPEFYKIMDDVKAGIQYLFQTKNTMTFAVSGSGHAAMEAACCNLVEPGDVVVVGCNGLWGERFADMTERTGGNLKPLIKDYGQVFSMDDIEKALMQHNPAVLFLTHGDSSGGTMQPLEGVGALCHKHNCLLIVDSVASIGGVPLFMDKWDIDVLYTGAQKVLNAPPGASPISFNSRAWEKITKRKTKIQSFYLDATLLTNYWGCDGQPRRYHHTAPITSVYQLREALASVAAEGLQQSWQRHRKCAELLYSRIHQLGLELYVKDERTRLTTITLIKVPPGIIAKQMCDYVMDKYKIEIAMGMGEKMYGKVWRIGLLGGNATEEIVQKTLAALEDGVQFVRNNPSGAKI